MGIVTQAGFSRSLFTGENQHGPHRCGSWRGSPSTTAKCSKRIRDTHNASPTTARGNPRRGEFQTHWGHKYGRSLDELAEPIPKGWRLPVKPTTDTGRNCALFAVLMKWAGSPCNLKVELIAVARAANDGLDAPLSDGEVTALAKSVERYRRSWIAKGRFYTEAEREAWGRSLGLQSAVARRKVNADRDFRIIEGHAAGWSQRHLAKLFKMSQHGVWKVLQRAGGHRTTQAPISG